LTLPEGAIPEEAQVPDLEGSRVKRQTMVAALLAAAAFAIPAGSRADAPPKVTFDISNETGGPFQIYFKSLGDEYSVPAPPKATAHADVPATDLVLIMFEAGPHGDKKRAYSVNVPAGAGTKLHIKLVTKSDAKGVYIASQDGAASVVEINVFTYLNS
jgi:hypothetical protein